MSDKEWLDSELWNFVRGAAIDLEIPPNSPREEGLYRNMKQVCEVYARLVAAECRAPAPQPANYALALDVVDAIDWIDQNEPKRARDVLAEVRDKLRAATPQVTPELDIDETAPWKAAKQIVEQLEVDETMNDEVREYMRNWIHAIIAVECRAPAPQLGRCPLCGSDKADIFLGKCAEYHDKREPAHIFHWVSTSDSHRAKMRGLAATPQASPTPEKPEPTYYVRHPDDSYTAADPQPRMEKM